MVPFSRLLVALAEVPDPRRAQGKRYPLPYLLLFTVLALLSGAESYRGIIIFLDQRLDLLNDYFGVTLKRAPALNTLRNLLQSLDAAALESAFRDHARGLLPAAEAGAKPVIALDGKTLRGSFDHLEDRKAAQALMAFASEAAILLAHTEIAEKTNDPKGSAEQQDPGCRGDDPHPRAERRHLHGRCHALPKKAFQAARDTENVLIAQVKANQPTLHDTLKTTCADLAPRDRHSTVDRNRHGRQEHRLIETFDVKGKVGDEWDGLVAAVARVTRLTWHKDTKSGLWHETSETSLYASLEILPAAVMGNAIRLHWGIENRNNYVRDVSLNEDASRIRNKPATFARFRSFALNILRANAVSNIRRELYINALNPEQAMAYAVT